MQLSSVNHRKDGGVKVTTVNAGSKDASVRMSIRAAGLLTYEVTMSLDEAHTLSEFLMNAVADARPRVRPVPAVR